MAGKINFRRKEQYEPEQGGGKAQCMFQDLQIV